MPAKKILLLFCLLVFIFTAKAQTPAGNYMNNWKKIDALINNNGQTKTALKEVNILFDRAKKEKNEPQMIKALLYKLTLSEQLSENATAENIATIEKEIRLATQPAKSILYSISAGYYWNYLQQNRYRFYNRTAILQDTGTDVATASLDALHRKIGELYRLSITEEAILKKTNLAQYDAIIIKGNARNLRPTLFDLLAHRALDYYKNDETGVSKPAHSFEISDPLAFSEAKNFSVRDFSSDDPASLQYKALQLFQQLIGFHLKDQDPAALIDVDIERLQFVQQYGVMENKEAAFQSALEKLTAVYPTGKVTEAIFLLASLHSAKAALFDPLKDTAYRYEKIIARELCTRALQTADSSEGKTHCANLLKEILRQEISITGETVVVPGTPFRVLVSYRNVSTGFFRIVKTDKLMGTLTRGSWNPEYWQQLLKLPAYTGKEYGFPATNDYQQHRVEIALDALPVGEYALIASSEKGFPLKSNALCVQYFYVSNIAYVNKGSEYYVVNRTTGAPMEGARVNLWKPSYNNQSKRILTKLSPSYQTDKNGFFSLQDSLKKQPGLSYFLDIHFGNDRFFQDRQTYYHQYMQDESSEEEDDVSYLFTDRSIYRPGQTVYFKGIVVRKNAGKKSSVIAGRKSQIKLYDANSTVVDSLKLITNEFGSYSGKFILPSALLNGNFSIGDDENESTIHFSVEEYKRPKFEVTLKKPAGSYRVNDSVKVEGNAKGYAGNNISGATVTYRVVRNAMRIFENGYGPRIWPPASGETTEIAHGTLKTDNDGAFTVPFLAIPDKNLIRKSDPLFNYRITAEITDINGETRTAETAVTVGYHSIQLNLHLPAAMQIDRFRQLNISSTNMNDVFEKATVSVNIFKLRAPAKIFRERLWEQPDQFIMTKEAFYRQFPFDFYSDEDDKNKWPKEKKVISAAYTTSEKDSFALPSKITAPGWYVIQLSAKDRFNDTITATRYIQLFGETLSSPFADIVTDGSKTVAQPGDEVDIRMLTNLDSIYLVREVLKQQKSPQRSVMSPGNDKNHLLLTVSDEDRGQMAVNLFFVKNNRVYTSRYDVSVPFYNKQLKIDYLSFRDKTLPGTPEKWKVKISGFHAEKVTAELLTAMYDASLDQFMPHSWTIPPVWNAGISYAAWSGADNFSKSGSEVWNNAEPSENGPAKVYDRLATLDNDNIQFYARGGRPEESVVVTGFGTRSNRKFEGKLKNNSLLTESGAPAQDLLAKKSGLAMQVPAPVSPLSPAPVISARRNLNETAFFFPDLHTDSVGNVEFSFTTPEALTQWKWMLLAHTKTLAFAYEEKTMVTSKQLMVQPNTPRFLRQGDQLELNAKIVNMGSQTLTGMATLELTDAVTGEVVDANFLHTTTSLPFSISAGQSGVLLFPVSVPKNDFHPVIWKITASATLIDSAGKKSTVSDGEASLLPVISNRMLVTETLPLPVKTNSTKTFNLTKLLKSGGSTTLKQSGLTLEFTANPAWYAVQALPYLIEGEKENAEAVFNRFYANALASMIANSSPRFKAIIEKWRITDTTALISSLEKNEELKAVLLQETPWVLDAKNETRQKRNIALLFEFYTVSKNLDAALAQLENMQLPSGAFEWYTGGPGDRYMTQYIVTGIGRLKKLKAVPAGFAEKLNTIGKSAIAYLDQQMKKDYQEIKKRKNKISGETINPFAVQYLYMRSLFHEIAVPGDVSAAYNYYRNLSKKSWVKQNSYLRGMIALSLFRTGDNLNAKKVLTALKENSIENEALGMYWKDMSGGYYWYEAPVESQTLMIEAFSEIAKDTDVVNNMKTWLLKNKQANSWKTSKATADACYALLLRGADWTSENPAVNITLGDTAISSTSINTEAGTGYFKTRIAGEDIKPAMGKITVNVQTTANNGNQSAWGAVYWQYFEDLNKITSAATPLLLNKKLFIEKMTDNGPVLQSLDAGNTLHIGDKIKVRIELRSDRTLEYVHLKDMRASCMEPVNVISAYKYQGGLGYYESTKDAATHFYFGTLPKGVYVFEYTMTVTHSGTFSNGITTIQCMYAPEFTSHSEGIKVQVEKQ